MTLRLCSVFVDLARSEDCGEDFGFGDDVARCGENLPDDSGRLRDDDVFHLHGFEDADRLASRHALLLAHADFDHGPDERGANGKGAGR